MKLTQILTSTVAIAALTFIATPAFAQHRGGGGSRGGGGAAHASAPRSGGGGSRQVAAQRSAPRVVGSAGPRVVGPAGGRSYVRVAPRVIGGGAIVGSSAFYRRYHTFRPRISLGFGLWAGYPVAYPFYGYGYGAYPYAYDPYYNPYYATPYASPYGAPYADPNAYPPAYAPGYSTPSGAPLPYTTTTPNSIGAQPGAAASGGLSFEITPATAEVFVDGRDAGTVSSFSPTSQPLTLAPGRHHVELRAAGYQTLSFDTDVTNGEVIPYQGTMQPAAR